MVDHPTNPPSFPPEESSSSPEQTYHEEIWRRTESAGGLDAGYRPGVNLRVDAALRLLRPGQRLLDIGCGAGVLGQLVRDRFAERHGIDISDVAVREACRHGTRALVVNLNRLPVPHPPDTFDSVTALACLHLFYSPTNLLRECRRVLRPGGQLLVTLPNMRTWWRIIRLSVMGTFPRTSTHEVEGDGGSLHYYCPRDMCAMVEHAGFTVKRATGIFCLPRVAERLPDVGPVRWLKREFCGAETMIEAIKG